ncbi:hypothetical protein BLNAU_9297 [Blattamonas nauphoetae]|uniref:Uncharacterized protein n=1 Tax=Blattamonas nauphoetae TaxID=2049346 RepID=A0ABQ9XWA6_9EUKA|nr:hypothetical protein BLNAU_9297 [Blattamonas nauphoetae]
MTISPSRTNKVTKVIVPPLFMQIDRVTIGTIEKASRCYLSLVELVKSGTSLDAAAQEHACLFLDRIRPGYNRLFSCETILSKLIPHPVGTCSGLADSLVILLTCNSRRIVTSAFSFLEGLFSYLSWKGRYEIIETGLFSLLPAEFYFREVRLSLPSGLCLIANMTLILSCAFTPYAKEISQTRLISMETIRNVVCEKLVRPIAPVLNNLYRNKHDLSDYDQRRCSTKLLRELIRISAFHEETTRVLSLSSFPLIFTDSLISMPSDTDTSALMNDLKSNIEDWQKGFSAEQQKENGMVVKLQEEGFSDVIEQTAKVIRIFQKKPNPHFTAVKLEPLSGCELIWRRKKKEGSGKKEKKSKSGKDSDRSGLVGVLSEEQHQIEEMKKEEAGKLQILQTPPPQ